MKSLKIFTALLFLAGTVKAQQIRSSEESRCPEVELVEAAKTEEMP